MAYTSDSHEYVVGRLSESLPVETVLLLGEGDFGESWTPLLIWNTQNITSVMIVLNTHLPHWS